MAIKVLGIFSLLLLFACGQRKEPISSKTPLLKSNNDSLMQYSNDWKKDSLGCLKLRSKEKGEAIINFLRRDSITRRLLYEYLGKSNELHKSKDSTILVYYFDCNCNSGYLVHGSDKCYAKFYLKSDVLENTDFLCE